MKARRNINQYKRRIANDRMAFRHFTGDYKVFKKRWSNPTDVVLEILKKSIQFIIEDHSVGERAFSKVNMDFINKQLAHIEDALKLGTDDSRRYAVRYRLAVLNMLEHLIASPVKMHPKVRDSFESVLSKYFEGPNPFYILYMPLDRIKVDGKEVYTVGLLMRTIQHYEDPDDKDPEQVCYREYVIQD